MAKRTIAGESKLPPWTHSILAISQIRADKDLQEALKAYTGKDNPDVWNVQLIKALGVETINMADVPSEHWKRVDVEQFPTVEAAHEFLRETFVQPGVQSGVLIETTTGDIKDHRAFMKALARAVSEREADKEKQREFFEAATGWQNAESAYDANVEIDSLIAMIQMYEPPVEVSQEPFEAVPDSKPVVELEIVTLPPPPPVDEQFTRYSDLIKAALDARILSSNRAYQGYFLSMATGKKSRRELYDSGIEIEHVIHQVESFDFNSIPQERRSYVDEISNVPAIPPVSQPAPQGENRWWLSPQWQLGPVAVADFVFQSKLYPWINSRETALVLIFAGIELGLSPFSACQNLVMISGKVTMSGQLMLAKLMQRGVKIEYKERSNKACSLTMTRPDGYSIYVSYTIEDAKNAELVGKENWRKYPRAMLTWRAISEAARLIAADLLILSGIPQYTTEELSPNSRFDEQGNLMEFKGAA